MICGGSSVAFMKFNYPDVLATLFMKEKEEFIYVRDEREKNMSLT